MKMDPIIYVLAVLAVAPGILRGIPLVMFSIHERAFTAQIAKLLRAQNRDRALKLCNAVPRAYYVAMIKAVLDASTQCSPRDGQGLIEETLRDAFQREHAAQMRRVRKWSWLAVVGVLAAAGGLLAAGTDPTEPGVVYGPPVVALTLWIISWRKVRQLRDKSQAGFEEILSAATACAMASDD
jgi:hypothetical protein